MGVKNCRIFQYKFETFILEFNVEIDVKSIEPYIIAIKNLILVEKNQKKLKSAEDLMVQTKAIAEAKDVFLATMSHEIRTPLNGIIGMARVLESTNLDKDQIEYVDTIHHCSIQLLEIISDILDYSKMAANSLELQIGKVDIRQCIEESHDVLILKADEKNLGFSHYISSDVPDFVLGDVKRLKQILVNFLTNSIKFTEHGYVKTYVTYKDNHLIISVEDTGIGIPEKDLSRIFETFVQLDNSIARKQQGTGLGLGIIKKLVKLMNGTCEVNSQSEEDGFTETFTKFTVKLPMEIPEMSLSSQNNLPAFYQNKSVLIYEHENNNRMTLCTLLLKWKVKPFTANSVEEINMYLNNGEFVALLIDMESPSVSEILAMECKIPIIRILSVQQESPKRNLMSSKKINYIRKPIKIEKLRKVLLNLYPKNVKSPAKSPNVRKSYNLNIMSVEDNFDNQKVIVEFLKLIDPKIKVMTVSSGVEALKMASPEIDLILMDIKMPGMDGFECTKKIRGKLKEGCPYVVACTATVFENDKKKCSQAGMDAFIGKPILFHELQTLVKIIHNKKNC